MAELTVLERPMSYWEAHQVGDHRQCNRHICGDFGFDFRPSPIYDFLIMRWLTCQIWERKLESFTDYKLRKLAQMYRIKGYSVMIRQDLISALMTLPHEALAEELLDQ